MVTAILPPQECRATEQEQKAGLQALRRLILQGPYADAESEVRGRVRAFESEGYLGQRRPGVFDRYVRRQSPDWNEEVAPPCRGVDVVGESEPGVGAVRPPGTDRHLGRKREATRHHANDAIVALAKLNHATDRTAVGIERISPEVVTDDQGGNVGRASVARAQRPTQLGPGVDYFEQVGRDRSRDYSAPRDTRRNLCRERKGCEVDHGARSLL